MFIAVGTTLTVQPAASLTGLAADVRAEVVIVNAEPTPYDRVATRFVRDPSSTHSRPWQNSSPAAEQT